MDVAVELLSAEDGATVGDLQEAVGLPQATITRRLQDLESAGLVARQRRGHPYKLRERDMVSDLLRRASELAEQLLDLDRDEERRFRASLLPPPD